MLKIISKKVVSIRKDNDKLSYYMGKGYSLYAAIRQVLEDIGWFYHEGEFEVIELKCCYHVIVWE